MKDADERPKACRSCRAAIEWKRLPSGRWAPMQKVTQIYLERVDLAGDRTLEHLEGLAMHADEAVYVNHFQTCPDAAEWSR